MRGLRRCAAAAALTLACAAGAGDDSDAWTCVQDGLVREVTVYYPDAPARVPCQVFYTKRQENTLPRPLWRAARETGYCERQAAQFVAKLRVLGWQCTAEPPAGDTPPA